MVQFIRTDLDFILAQIKISEAHAAGQDLASLLPNPFLPWGLRTVDGSLNNLLPGQEHFGAADNVFPTMTTQYFTNGTDNPFTPGYDPKNYAQPGSLFDSQPRLISNLIVDQTANNPAAVAASETGLTDLLGNLHIPNVAPDEGLSAPFNSWMTLFGQFFDHGLDLVTKGGNGTVFIPLAPDDPLYNANLDGEDGIPHTADDPFNFMLLTRTTNIATYAGADNVFGTSDDVHTHMNTTTPWIDQNQTYTSHASHQVFLREYAVSVEGKPVSTGHLLEGANGGLATWAEVKSQTASLLGIQLTDADVTNVPLLATDLYGAFIRGANGYPQLVLSDGSFVEGDPTANGGLGVSIPANVLRTGHAFLDDIAHGAAPGTYDHDGNPMTPELPLVADSDEIIGGGGPGTFDDELLNAHFVTGDGRGNENIGLTTVHFIFHAEHNRLVEHTKEAILATGDAAFIAEWKLPDGSWNGERLFQAARFGTEMQYQHLVFEEFARKVQPMVNVFAAYDHTIDPSIVAEFAHTVYRFGHSMLTETVDRFDADFNADHIGLIEAFLNPLEFTENGTVSQAEMASSIVRGMTRQAGNEIDEFVTEALRNNLLGLPLDLAAINLARGRETGVATLNEARREFYAGTGDSQLKPYVSWVDFAMNAKNELSVVNFIAAYGTHAALQDPRVDTIVERRDIAWALVTGDTVTINAGEADEWVFTPIAQDRLDFLNSQGIYANLTDGRTITGVDAIDFWIGGLAEAKMPFGGMLGSTFNFVFESQLEALQDGDRFYYLLRTAGLNFLNQLESNSFAGMIMRHTDATHLPGDVFSTPTYVLEVDQSKQFNDGLGSADPTGDSIFNPLVIRNDPSTPGLDSNYLQFTGGDHVVLGGTEQNDTLIGGLGDDTLWGDGGDDRLEGGAGNDILLGGDGDDIIQDSFGDDNIQGGNGNDVINGGQGFDLILGGFGNDFIVGGEDPKEIFGGGGDDFILGGEDADTIFGNEGDDWIEGGPGSDLLQGDNGDPFGEGNAPGNDVFIGGGGDDDFDAESGDDIMIAGAGVDRLEGMLGFDWVSYKNETAGVEADMEVRVFAPPLLPGSPNAFLDRFDAVEGLSGTAFSDILRGDDADAAEMIGHELTNFELIYGLKDGPNPLFNAGLAAFTGGNILLGGAGSDIIEGRGGNDIIDGDAWLNVRLSIRDKDDPSIELFSANSMTEFQHRMFSGEINPSQIRIIREILFSETEDFDTAVYSDVIANYSIEGGGFDEDGDGYITISHNDPNAGVGLGVDGVDRVRNIERLQFADATFVISGANGEPSGLLTIDDDTPDEDQLLTVSALGVTDPDNITIDNPTGAITAGPIAYFWQVEEDPGTGVYADIVLEFLGEEVKATGTTFKPGDDFVGLSLRVRAVYQDSNGVLEEVFSAPTQPVLNVNDPPVGSLLISDTTPEEDQLIVAVHAFTDPDGIDGALFTYQWQEFDGFTWSDIPGAITEFLAPDQPQVGRQLRVTVTFTDDGGTEETVTSAATAAVTNVNDLPFGAIEIDDMSPTETLTLTALVGTIFDEDGTLNADYTFQWLAFDGFDWVNIDGATGLSFTPTQAEVNREVKVVVSYVDDLGTAETIESEPTIVTGDFINGTNAGQTMNGTAGQDIIFGNGGADTLNGGAEDDFLDGGNGADTLNGDDGNDTLNGGSGADIINGGAGDDTIHYVAGEGADTVDGGDGFDTMNVTGTGGDDSVRVHFNGTTLAAIGGGSVINVEAFNIDLGAGSDTLSYAPSGATITTADLTVDLLNGVAPGFDSIAGIENVTGGSGNDTFIGDENANVFLGGAGNDTFIATTGDGNDTYNGGGGSDTYDLSGTNAGATITTSAALSADTGVDVITNVENFIGSQGNDTIVLNGGANFIDGQDGDDFIDAGGGADTIIGGAGNDILFGGGGADRFVALVDDGDDIINGGAGSDTYDLSATTAGAVVTTGSAFSAQIGLDTLVGIENIIGSQGNDTIIVNGGVNVLDGQDGDDFIDAGAGNDTIIGGAGNDTLIGGAGNDTFVFQTGFGHDTIIDFDALPAGGQDRLQLGSSFGINAGNFAANVSIAASGGDTLITIGGDTITLLGVAAANVTIDDFTFGL